MACNCKNKDKFIEQVSGEKEPEIKTNIFQKILNFFAQFLFGILCGALIIIMSVPTILYVIICVMFGLEAKFKLRNPLKKRTVVDGKQ